MQAAARVRTGTTATRTTYGQARLWTQKSTTEVSIWLPAHYTVHHATILAVSVLIPSPLLCAVSWIRIIVKTVL